MNRFRLFLVLLLAVAAATLSASSFAQSSDASDVIGSVKDSSGDVISQAIVVLFNAGQPVATAQSDSQGQFTMRGILRGSYELLVSHRGFASRRVTVRVPSPEAGRLEITLGASPFAEEVTVTAETGLAQEKANVPQQVNVIPEDALSQRVSAVLAQVADEEAGLSMQRTSPTIGAVVVRGLTEVGVYVDGVRYTNSTQRGGINTFFNLNEPTSLRAIEVLRGPNTAQYGSDSLSGTVQLMSRHPQFGLSQPETSGEFNTSFTSADLSFGSNALVTYGTQRFGLLANVIGRRVNTVRPGEGIDGHSAITRFLGLPSDILGNTRLPDTAFTQYGGTVHLTFAPSEYQQLNFRYQRSQQDGGQRYDQLLGGDGNLRADLRNLMLDFLYGRYSRQRVGFFDNLSATFSYNSQREERVNQGGQGNPLAAIIHDKERTSTFGFSFHLDKLSWQRNNFLIGGDIYRDHVDAPSFSLDPATQVVTLTRPRVPDGARYLLAGVYVQNGYEMIQNRLRVSGALRYNGASYRSRAADSPLVDGQALFPDDSLRVDDFSGRLGAVVTIVDGFNVALNFSRGFRAPNITSLGSVGLVGVGFQVAASEVLGLMGTVGSTADENAVSTGVPVTTLKSETSNNYDLSFRFRNRRIETDLTGYIIDYGNAIVRQTLILPPGAVGLELGSQVIERQHANGAVFVPLSPSPVLVQANFGGTRLQGIESTLNVRLADAWTVGANYSYVRAADRETGLAPNLGGAGVPPQLGFLRLRYQPGKSYWIEAYSTLANRQDRLSSLDLSDRRTGATRSRTNIQDFFRRGACIYGLTTPGPGGCGTSGGVLIATGERLSQVQDRVLGGADSAPLFTYIPGYGLINLRGGFRFWDDQEFSIDFENIADKSHRLPGWGIDGPGRSVSLRYRYRF